MSAPVADLMRLAKWAIRSWVGHAEYDDMLGEAYLAAWQGYQKGQVMGARSSLAIATKEAKWAPMTWLRRWEGREDHSPLRYHARHLSLERLLMEADEPEATKEQEDVLLALTQPGLEGEILDRLEREALVARLLANCTPRQRQVFYRIFWLQETKAEAATALGINRHTVGAYYQKAVESCREWV